MDVLTSESYLEELTKLYGRDLVVACSAEAELVLRRSEKMGVLCVEKRVMDKFMRTGILQALNAIVFKLLRRDMVYGVSDEITFSDHHGNMLPDVHVQVMIQHRLT
jgi:hypothetical protein